MWWSSSRRSRVEITISTPQLLYPPVRAVNKANSVFPRCLEYKKGYRNSLNF